MQQDEHGLWGVGWTCTGIKKSDFYTDEILSTIYRSNQQGDKRTKVLKYPKYILANSNVEISCHFVDIKVSVYPAGSEGTGVVLSYGRRENKDA